MEFVKSRHGRSLARVRREETDRPPHTVRAHTARRRPSRFGCVVAITLLGACASDPPAKPLQLPSGRTIDVLWSGVLGQPPRVWALKYRSRLPIADRDKLEDEAAEVWEQFRAEADASAVERASLWPSNLDSHVIHVDDWRLTFVTIHSPDFSFEKDDSGNWSRMIHGLSMENRAGQ
jgi:hypothetical protein